MRHIVPLAMTLLFLANEYAPCFELHGCGYGSMDVAKFYIWGCVVCVCQSQAHKFQLNAAPEGNTGELLAFPPQSASNVTVSWPSISPISATLGWAICHDLISIFMAHNEIELAIIVQELIFKFNEILNLMDNHLRINKKVIQTNHKT